MKRKINKLARRYNATEDKSKPTGFKERNYGYRTSEGTSGSNESKRTIEPVDELKGRTLLSDDDVVGDGKVDERDNKDSVRTGSNEKNLRRFFKRRG